MRDFAQDIISSIGVLIYLKQTHKKTSIEIMVVIIFFKSL